VLGCICVLTLFMSFCCFPMRFRSFFVVLGCFVVVVFRHFSLLISVSIPVADTLISANVRVSLGYSQYE
jgi:hypothetical protein